MDTRIEFRASLPKRALGWFVCLGAAFALIAMMYAIATHPEAQTPPELLSGALIGLFLIGFMVAGIAIQHVYWSIEGDAIISHRLFKNKRYPLSELAGFGHTIVIVAVFPLAHVDLYNPDMKQIARLPISIKDWPKAEARLAEDLRYVVNDGSPALPRYRFADTPKI
ncbi:hypothetical protein [Allosphingosinicella deserti]|uniref:DUF304 domain-containing protein n=1 Tax=Allosphingosinicella deserti TaxID=2116704 RepID=A0A2P7QIU8_9SPHN|nr:hypothetical protein [Sphingomonas deserti]PSJ37905.1 hypothetical protein C7I55_19530 [Sphingomonas deserti]